MHNNQKYCEYHVKTLKCNHVTKKELSMDIDTRPRYMASESNTVFARSLLVNVKEASGISLITFYELTNLHRCTLARILILHPELTEAIIFGPKMA